MMMPPNGRATNPTVYVPYAASVPASGANVGKNIWLKTSAAAVPYRKKSYHSMVVPAKLASATRRIDGAVRVARTLSIGRLGPPALRRALRVLAQAAQPESLPRGDKSRRRRASVDPPAS